MRPLAPCKDCESRYPYCHSKCEDYKAWKAVLEKEAKARQKESDKHNSLARNKELFRKVGMQR